MRQCAHAPRYTAGAEEDGCADVRCLGVMIIGLVAGVVSGSAEGPPTLTGFDGPGAAAQQQLETKFVDAVRKDDLKGWLERLAARPHHVGSPYDKENAEFIAELFKSWGFETRIERFDVLFPTPKTRELELTAPTKYVAKLAEPAARAGCDIRPDLRAAAHLQRVLDRRRRHRAARLRELRRPRRLRGARPARHRRERQDRHRPLRRIVARHQAEGRRRARRGRAA